MWRRLCFWVLLGIIPGTMLLKLGAPWIIKVVLGVLIIGLGVEMLTRDKAKQFRPNPIIKAVMCFLSGVTAGLFGINLLFLIYMERSSTDRRAFRANTCFVFLIENAFRVVAYVVNGIFTAFSCKYCGHHSGGSARHVCRRSDRQASWGKQYP